MKGETDCNVIAIVQGNKLQKTIDSYLIPVQGSGSTIRPFPGLVGLVNFTTSASTCLQHSRNLGTALKWSPVYTAVNSLRISKA